MIALAVTMVSIATYVLAGLAVAGLFSRAIWRQAAENASVDGNTYHWSRKQLFQFWFMWTAVLWPIGVIFWSVWIASTALVTRHMDRDPEVRHARIQALERDLQLQGAGRPEPGCAQPSGHPTHLTRGLNGAIWICDGNGNLR